MPDSRGSKDSVSAALERCPRCGGVAGAVRSGNPFLQTPSFATLVCTDCGLTFEAAAPDPFPASGRPPWDDPTSDDPEQ